MRLGKLRLELERLAARDVSLAEIEFPRVEVGVEKGTAVRDAGVSARVFGIDLDRAVEHLPCVFETLATQLMEILAPAQIVIVCLDVNRTRFLNLLLLAFAQNYAQCLDDCLRDVVLDG